MPSAEELFAKIDVDKSGTIDMDEMLLHFLAIGQEAETVSELFRFMDSDKSGAIDKEEFVKGYEAFTKLTFPEDPELDTNQPCWEVKLKKMQNAVKKSHVEGKTPILLDSTGNNSAITFFKYQDSIILEAKRYIGEVLINKNQTEEEFKESCRKQLVNSMIYGKTLVVYMEKTAASFREKICDDKFFPIELFTAAKYVPSNEKNITDKDFDGWTSAVNTPEWHKRLASGDELKELEDSYSIDRTYSFNVVVVSNFEKDDYAEFLEAAIPLDQLQAINIS